MLLPPLPKFNGGVLLPPQPPPQAASVANPEISNRVINGFLHIILSTPRGVTSVNFVNILLTEKLIQYFRQKVAGIAGY